MKCLVLTGLILLTGCATFSSGSPKDKKREDVISCIKELKNEDDNVSINEAYEVCRQLYAVKKMKD